MSQRTIIVNGVTLSSAQAATLRMALGCFKLDLDQAAADPKFTHFGHRSVAEHMKTLDELHELIGDLPT